MRDYTKIRAWQFADDLTVAVYAATNGQSIAERDVIGDAEAVRSAAEKSGVDLTFFEIATMMALLEFRRREVDLAVVEVGLGGRLDATNVVRPAAAVITSIGLEHRELLGDTIEAIAAEKAGIIKPGTTIVTGQLPPEALAVVAEKALACQARWLRYDDDFGPGHLRAPDGSPFDVPLAGSHQLHNAAVAVATVRALRGAFPLRTEAECRAIARATFAHFGRLLIELLKFSSLAPHLIRERVEFEGRERVEHALARGKGVLLFTGHFGFWEQHALAHALGVQPMSVVSEAIYGPKKTVPTVVLNAEYAQSHCPAENFTLVIYCWLNGGHPASRRIVSLTKV